MRTLWFGLFAVAAGNDSHPTLNAEFELAFFDKGDCIGNANNTINITEANSRLIKNPCSNAGKKMHCYDNFTQSELPILLQGCDGTQGDCTTASFVSSDSCENNIVFQSCSEIAKKGPCKLYVYFEIQGTRQYIL